MYSQLPAVLQAKIFDRRGYLPLLITSMVTRIVPTNNDPTPDTSMMKRNRTVTSSYHPPPLLRHLHPCPPSPPAVETISTSLTLNYHGCNLSHSLSSTIIVQYLMNNKKIISYLGLSSKEDTSAATISDVKSTPAPTPNNNGNQQRQQGQAQDESEVPPQTKSWSIEAPILLDDDDEDDSDANASSSSPFPTPTGKEYDLIDSIAAELPSIIDEESNEQVQDYIQACNKGRGPMVACFSTAEYLSLFLSCAQIEFNIFL